jgi:hypothetical protein
MLLGRKWRETNGSWESSSTEPQATTPTSKEKAQLSTQKAGHNLNPTYLAIKTINCTPSEKAVL